MKIINNLLVLLIWILNIFSIVFNISFNYEVNILICISLSIIVVLPRLLKKYIKLSEISEFIFLIFIILLNTSHNYNLEYTIKDVKVNENYHKKAKYYSFVFTYENNEYEVISFDVIESILKIFV